MKKAVFIDKDGTLIKDVPFNVDPGKIFLNEGVGEVLKQLAEKGYLLIIVSNQSGIAKGYFTREDLDKVGKRINELLVPFQVKIDDFYYCPHEESIMPCMCRKPKPGLLLHAAENWEVDLLNSWMIGDILNDVEAGNRAGCRTILFNNGGETEWLKGPFRQPEFVIDHFGQAATLILGEQKSHSHEFNTMETL